MSPPSRNVITAGYPVFPTDPLAELRIENDQYPDRFVMEAADDGEPITTREGRRAAYIGGLVLDTDQVRAVRDWCNAWMMLYGERHRCAVKGDDRPFECVEDVKGRFWAGEETVTHVDFCPICGMKAPVPTNKERVS